MKIILLAFFSLISALAFDAPPATLLDNGLELMIRGWSPRPTEPPSMRELIRRQQELSSLILAPDGTCGYISGSSASPFGLCCATCTCGFQTTPHAMGKFMCCNTVTCESRTPTTCIDAYSYTVLSKCGSACDSDTLIMKCTALPFIYCNLAEFEGVTVQALFCDTVTVSHTQSIYTTYSGQLGRVFKTFTGFNTATSTTSSSSTSSTTSSSTTSSSSSSSTSSSSATTSETIDTSSTPVNSGGSIITSVITITPSSSPDASSSPPIGAIVGGSVGGFAFLALIGIGAIFLIRRPKPTPDSVNDPNKPPAVAVDTPFGGPQKPNPTVNMAYIPPVPPAGYDPNMIGIAAGGYTMQQQQQQQQQQQLHGTGNTYYEPPQQQQAYGQDGYAGQQAHVSPQLQSTGQYNLSPPLQQQWQPQQSAYAAQQQHLNQEVMQAQTTAVTQQAYLTNPQYNPRFSELRNIGHNVQAQVYQSYRPEFTELNAAGSPVAGPGQSSEQAQDPGLTPGASAAAVPEPEPPTRKYTDPNLVPAPLNISGSAGATGAPEADASANAAPGDAAAGAVPGADAVSLGSVPHGARMSSPHELSFDGFVFR